MKTYASLLLAILFLRPFNTSESPLEIIRGTIEYIETLQTISYKQDMIRTNPQNISEIISRYREMYFERLKEDSLVGVKGHWYMYVDDKENVIYEDIYDGNKLIRKNNRNRTAIIYDFLKYPLFRERQFWSHNTPFSMQYMFSSILKNKNIYKIKRLDDVVINNIDCFHIMIRLEDKESMPGYSYNPVDKEGSVSITEIFIDKKNYFPIRMRMENYTKANPGQIFFTDQIYYDIKFNIKLNAKELFDTSSNILDGYDINEIEP